MRTFGKALLNHWGWLVYGLLSATVVFLLTRGGVNLSPDSINYLSIAQILKTSQWIKSFVATNPPFFPLSIALINSLGFEAEVSTRIISVISYSVLVIIIFLLAKATSGALVAHLSSISMLFFAPLLFVYSYCWSETAYIALSAISLLTLDRFYRSTGVKSKRYLMWCAVFVGLALLARYIGVALFLTGFLLVLFKKETQMPIEKIKSLILFSIIACTPLTVYLMGCLHYQGRLPGYGGHGLPGGERDFVFRHNLS